MMLLESVCVKHATIDYNTVCAMLPLCRRGHHTTGQRHVHCGDTQIRGDRAPLSFSLCAAANEQACQWQLTHRQIQAYMSYMKSYIIQQPCTHPHLLPTAHNGLDDSFIPCPRTPTTPTPALLQTQTLATAAQLRHNAR